MSTPDRTYCAKPGYGHWIRPEFIVEGYGLCLNSRLWDEEAVCYENCYARTWILCKNLWHDGSDCPKDKELEELTAKEGWRK